MVELEKESIKNYNFACGAREVAQQLKPDVLAEESGFTWWFTTIRNSSPRGSYALFSSPEVPGMHTAHILILRQNTQIQRNK